MKACQILQSNIFFVSITVCKYSIFSKTIKLVLVLPVTNLSCGRIFSTQNRINSKFKNLFNNTIITSP